jgi:hypothetical protein
MRTKTGPESYFVVAIAALLVACGPSPNLPITGEVKLDFVRKAPDIHFKLKNQTPKQIAFWGARDWWWEGVFPQGPQFECVLVKTDQIHESPYPLIDGPAWKEFVVGSSEEIDIVINNFYLRDSDGRLPTGKCSLVFQLEGGVVVKSEEFESMASSS